MKTEDSGTETKMRLRDRGSFLSPEDTREQTENHRTEEPVL